LATNLADVFQERFCREIKKEWVLYVVSFWSKQIELVKKEQNPNKLDATGLFFFLGQSMKTVIMKTVISIQTPCKFLRCPKMKVTPKWIKQYYPAVAIWYPANYESHYIIYVVPSYILPSLSLIQAARNHWVGWIPVLGVRLDSRWRLIINSSMQKKKNLYCTT
jgi:hypothetical protein